MVNSNSLNEKLVELKGNIKYNFIYMYVFYIICPFLTKI